MKFIYILLALSFLSSCIPVRYPDAKVSKDGVAFNSRPSDEDRQKVENLSRALADMDPAVSIAEARRTANMAVYYPQVLANKYELTTPPIVHNILVNNKIRPRGLCINWTEDLINKLLTINPKTLDIYWGVANFEKINEHSSLVVTAKNKPFNTGILLDPWRNSGKLFWTRVTKDLKYKWNNNSIKPDYNKIRDYHVERAKRVKISLRN